MASNPRPTLMFGTLSDEGSVSGGSWLSGLPLSNVLSPRLEFVARSTDTDPANTSIKLTLKRLALIGGLYLGWTNLSSESSVRVRLFPTSSFSGGTIFDTGPQATIPDDPDPYRDPSSYIVFDTQHAAQYIQIDIADEDNLHRYIQIGRLLTPGVYVPSSGRSESGNGLSFKDRSIVASTLSGNEVAWANPSPRIWRGQWNNLPRSELFGVAYDALRSFDRGQQVIVVSDPTQSLLEIQRTSFLGEVTSRDPMVRTLAQMGSFGLELTEIMGLAPIGVPATREHYEAGVIVVMGTPIGIGRALVVSMGTGLLAVHGGAIGLKAHYRLPMVGGKLAVAGIDVALRHGSLLPMAGGVLAVTGGALDVISGSRLSLKTVIIAVNGKAIALLAQTKMPLGAGRLAVEGFPLNLHAGLAMPMAPGSIALAGGALAFKSHTLMEMAAGSIAISGAEMRPQLHQLLEIATGRIAVSGNPLDFLTGSTLPLDGGQIAIAGSAVSMQRQLMQALGSGRIAIAGKPVGLNPTYRMPMDAGRIAISGKSIGLDVYALRRLAGSEAGNGRALAGAESGNRRRLTE